MVNFVNNGTTMLGSGTLTNGVATFSSTTLGANNYSITAVYLGDATHSGSTSSAQPLTITAPSTGEPQIAVTVASSGVQSTGVDYVNLKIANTGKGPANNIKITLMVLLPLSGPGFPKLDSANPTPISVGTLQAGQSTTVKILVDAPATVTRFIVGEGGTVMDYNGKTFGWASAQLASN
jgi:hypothetical protein